MGYKHSISGDMEEENTTLLDMVRDKIRVKYYSIKTEKPSYISSKYPLKTSFTNPSKSPRCFSTIATTISMFKF